MHSNKNQAGAVCFFLLCAAGRIAALMRMKLLSVSLSVLLVLVFAPAKSWAQMRRVPAASGKADTRETRNISKKLAPRGTANAQPTATVDPGKSLPAGNSGSGYRKSSGAAGPGSSHAEYTSTQDVGKALPASGDSGGYRKAGDAAGPSSSMSDHTPTTDPGVSTPVSGSHK
jgi:hypothetical protein